MAEIGAPVIVSEPTTDGIELDYNGVSDAEGVKNGSARIVVATDKDFKNIVDTTVDGDFNGKLELGTTYYARVQAETMNGETGKYEMNYSKITTFETLPEGLTLSDIPDQPNHRVYTRFYKDFTEYVNKSLEGCTASIKGEPDGLGIEINSQNKLIIKGTPKEVGTFTITITLEDSEENVVSDSFKLRITPEPQPPKPDTDSPSTVLEPTIESGTDTTLDLAPGTVTDSDGKQNITVVLYTDAACTIEYGRAADGVFIGLTAGTSYWSKTEAQTMNGISKQWETSSSNAVEVKTDTI